MSTIISQKEIPDHLAKYGVNEIVLTKDVIQLHFNTSDKNITIPIDQSDWRKTAKS